LPLREAAGLAGRSFSFWGQVERGERAVTNRNTLEAMAGALRVAPTEPIGQPYTRADSTTSEAHAVVSTVETR
jgi:transcriptional regulator with XRE-family HTH domain